MTAKLLMPERSVACFIGEGGFAMVQGELGLAASLGLGLTIVVFCDNSLNRIELKQMARQYPSSGTRIEPTDMVMLAQSMGCDGVADDNIAELEKAFADGAAPDRPLVIDTIGELERIFGLADVVFIGGSLVPHGGHNMLEPAAQGLPVVYGPHVENFPQEALLLEEAGGARRVADADELSAVLRDLLGDADARAAMARAGIEAVEGQKGAAARTLALLRERCFIEARPGIA